MNDVKELVENLGASAQQVASLELKDVVSDVDLLTVALCTSGLVTIARTLSSAKEGENVHTAAHRALDIGWNISLRSALAEKGYFAEGVRSLLELAEENPLAGSRLMPVFDEIASVYKDLCIPKKLKRQVADYYNKKLDTDGFAIGPMDENGKTMVRTAEWVNRMVTNERS